MFGLAPWHGDRSNRSSVVIGPANYTLREASFKPSLHFLFFFFSPLSSNWSSGPSYWINRKIKYFRWRGTLLYDLKGKPEQFIFLFVNLMCQWPRYRRIKRYTATSGPQFCQQWSRWSDYLEPYLHWPWISVICHNSLSALISVSHAYDHRVYFLKGLKENYEN